jgi:hypothetical protein
LSTIEKELIMNKSVRTILYPVKEIEQAKKLYSTLLGVEPFVDQPYYVAYMVGDQQIGLVPTAVTHRKTATGLLSCGRYEAACNRWDAGGRYSRKPRMSVAAS